MHPASDINDRVLQEVNHRVKNNLQIVSSILDLQIEFAGQKTTSDILNSMKQRIQSMAVLHDHLFESDTRSHVDLAKYLKAVADQTCILFDGVVACKTKTQLQSCWASPQKLPLVGLLINELVMNALAHGRNESDEAIIRLEGGEKDGNYWITLADQGGGFEDSLQIRNQKLGLRLVEGLVRQFKGKIERINVSGTCWKIQIPITNLQKDYN
jgi:two-component sensor histidine kinase